ncbi:MAG: DUF1189 family protein [Gammaproteobacteria bacterium]|jgi:hypothetical protein
MSHTNLLTAIVKSFYSNKLYRETAQSWHGRSFLYLLVLLLICWVVISGVITFRINTAMHIFAQKIITYDFPTINFKAGIASTKATTPYHIKDPTSGQALIIIDTNNKVRDFHKSSATILIQKKSILIKDNSANKVSQYYYPKQMNMDIGPTQVNSFILQFGKWIMPLIFIGLLFIGLAVAYIYRIIQVLIYALIGMLFCLILKRRIPYESLMSLTIISITPAIIISTIAVMFNFRFPFQNIFYFLLSMVYLFIAVKANPKSEITVST